MATSGEYMNDLLELGLQSLSFTQSPARLLIADSNDNVLGINNAARRFLFPSSSSSTPVPINGLPSKLKDLPLVILDQNARRWIKLDQVLANVREELKRGDASHNCVEAATSGVHAKPNTPVRIESSLIQTSSGTVYSSLCLIPLETDIEAEKSTTAVVPKLMHMKDKILDHLHELVVFCLSIDGNLLVTNKAAEALLGDSTPEVGKGIDWLKERWKVYEPDFSAEIPFEKWGIYPLLTEGEIVRQTIGYYDPTGAPKVIELGGEPIKDDNGELVAGIVWLKDETSWHKKGEEKFRRICNSIPQMMFALTPDIKPEYFNQRWYEYTGLSIGEIRSGYNNPFWNICHPEDQLAVGNAWGHAVASKSRVQVQFRCRDSEGSYRWMLCRANCYLDDKGFVSKWYGTLTDVNEQIEAVEEQCRLQNQLSQIIHSSQLCVMTIENTPDRRISALHGRMIFPVGDKLALGANFLEAFKGYDAFTEPLERLLTKQGELIGPDITAEIEMKGKWFRCRFTPNGPRTVPVAGKVEGISPTKGGPVDAVTLVAADVTARYIADKEKMQLEERESAAVKESQLKSTFLANASHEIRTPISQIIGMSEVLLDTQLEDQQREYTTNINRSANALKAIISDILDLSKIEAKKMTITNSAFDLNLLLIEIIDMFKVTTSQKGLTFDHISILDESDYLVVGDQGRVRQILTNLMGNAFKFTSDGFIRMITMRDKEQPDPDRVRIRFTVEDSGVGISDEALKKIFVPFSQADHTTSARFGGTGLGLSISKELVELMHGEIALERSKGSPGCVAWFTIPFQRYDGRKTIDPVRDSESNGAMNRFRFEMERAMKRRDEEVSSVGSISPAPSPRARAAQLHNSPLVPAIPPNPPRVSATLMPPPEHPASTSRTVNPATVGRRGDPVRVLVIDDDEVVRLVFVRHLEAAECTVRTANNGKKGLEALEEMAKSGGLPHLVLTDCRMPVMDGYTFTRKVRTHPLAGIRNLPVVAMSAATTDEERAHCLEVGMTRFLSKPAKKEELYEVISECLKSRRVPTSNSSRPTSAPGVGAGGGSN